MAPKAGGQALCYGFALPAPSARTALQAYAMKPSHTNLMPVSSMPE